ncbi:hypothetical protein RSAG8_06651, partial [Rhizoctonia solani AG-8 WAC10335]
MSTHILRCPHFKRLQVLSGQIPPPDTPNHKVITALYLPAEHPNPKFIRIKLWEQPPHESGSPLHWIPDLSPVFGTSEPVAIDNLSVTSHVDGTPLSRPLQVFFRNTFRVDSSPLNQCLHNMVRGGAIPYPWAGDIVVLKFSGTRCEDYCNIRDENIPPLVYYLQSNDFGYHGSVWR